MVEQSDTNIASTDPVDTSKPDFFEEAEAKLEELGSEIKQKVEALVEEFDEDVLPYVKSFCVQLFQQDTKAALGALVTALPTLATGNVAAAAASVGAVVLATTTKDALADAQAVLQQAQAAMESKAQSETPTNTESAGSAK